MSHWILVINDTDKEFVRRMKNKVWPIFVHTHNRNNLKVGDKVVFYKAGIDGKKFIGTAKITSDLERTTKIDYLVRLSDVKVWKKTIGIDDLINNLDFILDKQYWGRFLQGGVKKITEKDFLTITA